MKLACFVLLFALTMSHAHSATLVYSNDIRGELGPCGCSRIRLGGMIRLESFIKSLKQKPDEILQLDAGNLLFENDAIPELLKGLSRYRADIILESLERIGLDAFTPGTTDFALGVDSFKKITSQRKPIVLSINIFKNGRRLFKPHHIFKVRIGKNSTRVLVIGVTSPHLTWPQELQIKPPLPLIKKVIQNLKSKYDLLILLSHQGIDEDKQLANQIQEASVIIGAHSQSFLQQPVVLGKTAIFQSSFLNQYIGSVPFENQLNLKEHRLVALDEKYDGPKDSPVIKIISKFEAYVEKVDREEAKLESEGAPHFQTLSSCVECHETQFKFWLSTHHANALQPLKSSHQLRNKSCLKCHTLGLGHPKGFSNLAAAALIRDSETKKITGMDIDELAKFIDVLVAKGAKEEFRIAGRSRAISQHLKNMPKIWAPVQCENCHGPALDHPFSLNNLKNINKSKCLSCHTRVRAPSWYNAQGTLNQTLFLAKLKSVSCPSSKK